MGSFCFSYEKNQAAMTSFYISAMTSFLKQQDRRQFLHLNTILIGQPQFLAQPVYEAQFYSFIMTSFNLNGDMHKFYTETLHLYHGNHAILCQARVMENHLVMSDHSIMSAIANSIVTIAKSENDISPNALFEVRLWARIKLQLLPILRTLTLIVLLETSCNRAETFSKLMPWRPGLFQLTWDCEEIEAIHLCCVATHLFCYTLDCRCQLHVPQCFLLTKICQLPLFWSIFWATDIYPLFHYYDCELLHETIYNSFCCVLKSKSMHF